MNDIYLYRNEGGQFISTANPTLIRAYLGHSEFVIIGVFRYKHIKLPIRDDPQFIQFT